MKGWVLFSLVSAEGQGCQDIVGSQGLLHQSTLQDAERNKIRSSGLPPKLALTLLCIIVEGLPSCQTSELTQLTKWFHMAFYGNYKPLTARESSRKKAREARNVTLFWLRKHQINALSIEKGIIDFIVAYHGVALVTLFLRIPFLIFAKKR